MSRERCRPARYSDSRPGTAQRLSIGIASRSGAWFAKRCAIAIADTFQNSGREEPIEGGCVHILRVETAGSIKKADAKALASASGPLNPSWSCPLIVQDKMSQLCAASNR